MEDNKKYNEIDMDCDMSILDDDDFSFGTVAEKPAAPLQKIVANAAPDGGVDIKTNFQSEKEPDYSKYNQIDMECEEMDDTEDGSYKIDMDVIGAAFSNDSPDILSTKLDFGDEDIELGPQSENHINYEKVDFSDLDEEISEKSILHKNQQFTREDLNLEEAKKDEGAVSINYWRDLAKKHAATNKKGARSYFELFGAFDPKRNMELFNHDATPQFKPKDVSPIEGGLLDVAVADATGGEISGDVGGGEAAGGEGGGMGESLDNVTNDLEKFSNIFERIDFDVTQNKEGKFEVIDLFESDPPQTFENMTEVLEYLKPYIMDELSLDEEEVDQYLKTL